MPARKIMIQGTGSYVGKSVVTAALCRYFRQEGFRVAPFKAQNMSNNSFVTAGGEEIGRAQAFQAQACGVEPTVEMNPILLKPSTETGAQVVVLGKAVRVMSAREYHDHQPGLVDIIRDSLAKLSAQSDIIVIEGAGSPAEINLRTFDIVNMRVAQMASAPVLLVGDINLGGVFASLLGTLELLKEDERALVKAFLINKFRGDVSLLQDGLAFLEARTGKKVLGVLPFLPDLGAPEEDTIAESKQGRPGTSDNEKLLVQVLHLPRISNSTDFEPLETEPDVELRYLRRPPQCGERFPDLLILPGSKSTVADLTHIRSCGLADYIYRCHEAGISILGICGGYQMLGQQLADPLGVESPIASIEGLGLLNVHTTFEPDKITHPVRATCLDNDEEVVAYEIHMGRTTCVGPHRPVFRVTERLGKPARDVDGVSSENGQVWGTYLHGLFDTPGFRRRTLNRLRERRGWQALEASTCSRQEKTLGLLELLVREHVNLPLLQRILAEGA
jgi:adenosylcobyric acid synthase